MSLQDWCWSWRTFPAVFPAAGKSQNRPLEIRLVDGLWPLLLDVSRCGGSFLAAAMGFDVVAGGLEVDSRAAVLLGYSLRGS